MDDFKWYEPNAKTSNDVTIKIGVTSTEQEQAYLTFRNGLYQMVSETGRIKIAVANNRVYFAESKKNLGYKLNKVSSVKADNRYVNISTTELVNRLRPYKGDYDLRHDNERDLYYIERKDEE